MIATDIGVRIQFRHERENTRKGERVITTCFLVNEENDNDIAVGSAFCAAEDQFRKELGRRIALTRALSNSELSKEDRRSIWNAYFGR